MKHLTEPLPIPPKGVALPPSVNGVLRKAMAREARERFATAGELAGALDRAADQRATVTLHASGIRRVLIPALKLRPWVRKLRSKEMRLSLAAITLAGMVAFVYALWPLPTDQTSAAPSETAPQASEGEGIDAGASPGPAELPAPIAPGPSAPGGRKEKPPAVDRSFAILEIESQETGRVFLDGKLLGAAPGTFSAIAPGEHLLVVDAGGQRREEKTLVLTAGSTHRVRFDFNEAALEPSSSQLTPRQVANAGSNRASAPTQTVELPEIHRWTGFLTDEDCGATGGAQGSLHLRCAERCIREGKKPMLYSRGRLYWLDGFEHLTVFHDQPLRFRAWLEGDILHVEPSPAGSATPSSSSSDSSAAKP
jgi:hypothetical protein